MNEDDLRERIRELRRHDARGAPEFQRMWTASKPARSPLRVVLPVALTLSAAAIFVVWCGAHALAPPLPTARAPGPTLAEPFDPAPLDFLLDTPGASALSIAPDLGSGDPKGW